METLRKMKEGLEAKKEEALMKVKEEVGEKKEALMKVKEDVEEKKMEALRKVKERVEAKKEEALNKVMEELEDKKEALMNVKEHVEEKIEPVKMFFRGRKFDPISNINTTNIIPTFSTTFNTVVPAATAIEYDSDSSDSSKGSAESLNDEKVNGKSRKRHSRINGGTISSITYPGVNSSPVNVVVHQSHGEQIFYPGVKYSGAQESAVKNHQPEKDNIENEDLNGFNPSPYKIWDQNGSYTYLEQGSTSEHRILDLGIKTAEEATEIYLEKLYQKQEEHGFYCPNCRTCITKVLIIRERYQEPPPPDVIPHKEELRCTNCFSFLVPAGNWIRNIFSSKNPTGNTATSTPTPKPLPSNPGNNTGLEEPLLPHYLDKDLDDQIPRRPHTDGHNVPERTEPSKPIIHDRGVDMPNGAVENNGAGNPATVTPTPKPLPNDPGSSTGLEAPLLGGNPTAVTPTPKPLPYNPGSSTGLEAPLLGEYTIREPVVSIAIPIPSGEQLPERAEPRSSKSWQILKSIVYGGLTESITSLGIVTSAASADAATMNVLALALANLIGGLFIICHNLWEFKNDESTVKSEETGEQVNRYQEVLGRKDNFFLHVSAAILSFLIFGLVPPVVYGFSFHESDDKNLKIAAVAGASLICITLLALAKARTQKNPKYIQTVLQYVAVGFGVSGASYAAGNLLDRLMEQLGWFQKHGDNTFSFPQFM